MHEPFLERLQQGPLLADGAMGTLLYSRLPGAAARARCFDEVTLSRPELVRAIHQEYIRAGAQVIETNTFGANRAKLSQPPPRRTPAACSDCRRRTDSCPDARVRSGGDIGTCQPRTSALN